MKLGLVGTFAELINLRNGVSLRACQEVVSTAVNLSGQDNALTNGANDGGTTIVVVRDPLGIKLGVPFQLQPVGKVVERVCDSHCKRLCDVDGLEKARRSRQAAAYLKSGWKAGVGDAR